MTHDDYKEMLAVLALEPLDSSDGFDDADEIVSAAREFDDEERDALAAHLAACRECRADFAALRETAALLAYEAAPQAPSPQVRARIFEQLRGGAEEAAVSAPEREKKASNVIPLLSAKKSNANRAEETKAEVTPYRGTRRSSSRRFLKFALLAASIAIVALGVVSVSLYQQNENLRRQNEEMQAQVERAETRRKEMSAQLAGAKADLNLLNDPNARFVQAAGTPSAPQARANIVLDKQTGLAIVHAENLPPAPAGKAYQIWYIAGGRPLPGKTFNADAEGRATLRDQIPQEARAGVSVIAVTLESASGATSPTGAKFLVGAVS